MSFAIRKHIALDPTFKPHGDQWRCIICDEINEGNVNKCHVCNELHPKDHPDREDYSDFLYEAVINVLDNYYTGEKWTLTKLKKTLNDVYDLPANYLDNKKREKDIKNYYDDFVMDDHRTPWVCECSFINEKKVEECKECGGSKPMFYY